MINQDVNKDLRMFLCLSEEATPFTLKNTLRIILGSKPEAQYFRKLILRRIEMVDIGIKKVCI